MLRDPNTATEVVQLDVMGVGGCENNKPQRAGAERALRVVAGGAMALPRSDGAGSVLLQLGHGLGVAGRARGAPALVLKGLDKEKRLNPAI